MNDEFKDLFVKEDETLNKKILNDTLKPYIELTKDGSIIFKEEFYNLQPKKKIIIYILAKKVLKETGIIENERVGVKVISDSTGIAYGTVGRNLRVFFEEGTLKQEENEYFLPNYNLMKVSEWLLIPIKEAG